MGLPHLCWHQSLVGEMPWEGTGTGDFGIPPWVRRMRHRDPGNQGSGETEQALTERLQVPWTQVPNWYKRLGLLCPL